MQTITTDVAIIGAGTAGIAAERKARESGARTLLIDPAFAGTTCATVGCMPSKLLIASATAAHAARRSVRFSIRPGDVQIDTFAVMRRVRDERDRFVDSVQENFEQLPDGVRVKATARFISPNELQLDNGKRVVAGAVVIASGASPRIPGLFANLGDLLLTNETLFDLPTLPRSVGVIGAGPLGIELAQALARLGVETAVYDMGERIAGIGDSEINNALHAILQEEFTIRLGVEVSVKVSDGSAVIRTSDGHRRSFERVLLAVGRKPAIDRLDVVAAGLETDEDGVPLFDTQTLQCGDTSVFIAGDANSERPVLHEAAAEGAIAGNNAASYPALKPSRRKVAMSIVFTDPNIALIGDQPENRAEKTVSGVARYDDQGRARVEARAAGIAKLHADATDGRLVGATMVGPDIEHLAHAMAWLIESGTAAQDILELPFYHPTFEEGLKGALREICAAVNAPRPPERDDGFVPGL